MIAIDRFPERLELALAGRGRDVNYEDVDVLDALAT